MVTEFFGTIAANAYDTLNYRGRQMARAYCGDYGPYDSDRVTQHFMLYNGVEIGSSTQYVMPAGGIDTNIVNRDCYRKNKLRLDAICEFEFSKIGRL